MVSRCWALTMSSLSDLLWLSRFVTPAEVCGTQSIRGVPAGPDDHDHGYGGRCCVDPQGIGEALSSKHLWTMTFDHNRVLPELICWQLNYAPWVNTWFAQQSQGAVMDAIRSTTLRTLKLPVPPINEQLLIRGQVAQSAKGCFLQSGSASGSSTI